MLEIFKIIFSKDFVSNAKDIMNIIKKSKDWRKDIIKFKGTFFYKDKIESTVLIEESIKNIKSKGWYEEEQQDVKFILNELFENSFEYGTPNKEMSFVSAEITITSTFIKLSLSDYGMNFNLNQELINQEAFNPESDKHKGLSLISKLTPEIYQEDYPIKNTIVVIKRQGLKPLKINRFENILVFDVGNGTYIDDSNIKFFLLKLNSLTKNEKVIINFGSNQYLMMSRSYRNIRKTLIDTQSQKEIDIVVCGLEDAPISIVEYFEKHFPIYNTVIEAKNYFTKN